jgi:hypothetical protein
MPAANRFFTQMKNKAFYTVKKRRLDSKVCLFAANNFCRDYPK